MGCAVYVSVFEEISLKDRPTVGGKGASLGELIHAGIKLADRR